MATSGSFHVYFQEILDYDVYVFLNFVGGINLIASRSIVLRMIFFTFLLPMRQQPLSMY